jgi:hypothetical protein
MADDQKLAIAKVLHQHNRRRFATPIGKDETLDFEGLNTPRCEECGSDLEPTLFGFECAKCKERRND